MRITPSNHSSCSPLHRAHTSSRLIGAIARSRSLASLLHVAAHARIAPPPQHCQPCPTYRPSRACPGAVEVIHRVARPIVVERSDRPRAWPFDTPMPSGLPALPIGTGHPLHPRAPGANESFGAGADKNRLPPLPPITGGPGASGAGAATDSKGMFVDVFA